MGKKRPIPTGETLPGLFDTHATVVAKAPAPLAVIVERFHALYLAAYGTKPAIPPRYLRDLKGHVERTGTSDALARLERLFAGEGPRWLRPPYDLATFVGQYDKLAVASRQKPSDLLHAPTDWRRADESQEPREFRREVLGRFVPYDEDGKVKR